MKALTDFAVDRPWAALLGALVLTVLVAFGMTRLESDPDVLRDLPEDLPARQLYDRIGEMFPGKEMLFVGLAGDALWTPEGIATIDQMTRAIEDLDVVEQVISPTNASIVRGTAEGMEIHDAMEALPRDEAEVAALRERLLSQDSLRGMVVSEDGRVASMVVFLSAHLATTESKAAGKVADVIEATRGPLEVYPTGRPLISYYSSKTVGKETGMLTSAALVLMIVLLGALFRNLRGVALPLMVVVIATLWTVGLMGWLRVPFTHSLEALPIMLIAIGVADGVHIVQAYMGRAAGLPHAPGAGPDRAARVAAVKAVMDDLRNPVIMTSVTTAAGFLALNTSGVHSIMTLGLMVAFGTGVALLMSLTLVPALLGLLPVPRRALRAEVRSRGYALQRAMRAWGDMLYAHPRAASAGVLALVAVSLWGATRVQSETSLLSNLDPNDPIAVSARFVNEHFNGVTNLMVVFEGEPGAVKDPAFLATVEAFERHARGVPGVGGTASIVPIIESMNEVLHAGDPAWHRLPRETETEQGFDYRVDEEGNEIEVPVTREVSGRELLDGYFALFEMQGRGRDLRNFVSDDLSSAKVTVFLKSDHKKDMDRIVRDLRGWMADHVHGARVEVTGMAALMLAVNDLITRGQGLSIAVSLVLVWVITALMFRSPVLGLFNVIPLFAAIFFNFGVMGLAGLDLNLMTMGVASMAIGVGVDFGIHFVHRYRHAFAETGEVHAALRRTFEEAGVAILMNMVAVAGGFLPLLLASFRGVMTMGLLISLIMAFSAFGALTILPLLFVGLRPRAVEHLAVLLAAGALLLGRPAHADAAGRAFMEQVLSRGSIHSMVGTATLTLVDERGRQKVRVFKMASRDNEEGDTDLIMRMEQPPDMRGAGFLVIGHLRGDDERYVYVPALHRVNRIVGSGRGGSFMSSEFSYEDIGSPDLDDWDWTLAGETEVDGHRCKLVRATPATEQVRRDTGYGEVDYAIDAELLTTRRAEFHDKAGQPFKTLVAERIEEVGGVPFATSLKMTDLASGRWSRLEMSDLVVNQPVEDAWFTRRALQQGF